ncbi:hypothetical protein [Pelagerythrobacter marensis]|uniref:Uncharacterized protein n=1 Tax=Pelagerythrobacter marensis TaxID=543877 RepID=A0A0G3X4K7_9SPHN|nr:hypothetical protein [Pelagerythrobacter marensis]AKM06122.1 hypothetical protein AM2010_27 [Pelagerythrobacter marensis]
MTQVRATKGKAKGRGAADKTAKKQPRRKSNLVGDCAPGETPTAYLVWGDGTDEEIAANFAERVPDWEDWSEREKRGAVELMRAYWDHPVAPTLTVERGESGVRLLPGAGKATIQVLRQAETFATNSQDLIDERVSSLATHHGNKGGAISQNLNASLAFIRGGAAQDTVQSALLTQMAATHDAAMAALAKVGKSEFVDQMTAFGNISTKLLNLYARQAETLAKLQRGAEQTVRHVYVDARTQTAFNYPPPATESRTQAHEQHEGGPCGPAMLGYDPSWNGLPATRHEREEALQPARGQIDGSARK